MPSSSDTFDPDAYLASTSESSGGSSEPKADAFDPDAYLKSKPAPAASRSSRSRDIPELKASTPQEDGLMTKIRESLSPLIGQTDRQKMAAEQDRMAMERDMPGLVALMKTDPNFQAHLDTEATGAPSKILGAFASGTTGGLDKTLIGKQGGDVGATTAGAIYGSRLGTLLGPWGRLGGTALGAMTGWSVNRIRQALSDQDPAQLGTPGDLAQVGVGSVLVPGAGKVIPTALKLGAGAVVARNAGNVTDTGQLLSPEEDAKTMSIATLLGGVGAKLAGSETPGPRSSAPNEVAKDNARAMVEKGSAVMPDEMNPTLANKLLTKVAGKGAVAKAVEKQITEANVKGALRAMGQPETALLNSDTHAAAQVAPGRIFDAIIEQGNNARARLAADTAKMVPGAGPIRAQLAQETGEIVPPAEDPRFAAMPEQQALREATARPPLIPGRVNQDILLRNTAARTQRNINYLGDATDLQAQLKAAQEEAAAPHLNNLKVQAGNDLKAWQEADSYARAIQKKIDAEGVSIGSTGTPHNLAQDLADAKAAATAAGNRVREGLRAAGQHDLANAFDEARRQFAINGEVERAAKGFTDGTIDANKLFSKYKRSGMPPGELADIATHAGAVKKGLDAVKDQSVMSAILQKVGPTAVGFGVGGVPGAALGATAQQLALRRLMSRGVQLQSVQPRYLPGQPVDSDLAKLMRYASVQSALTGN